VASNERIVPALDVRWGWNIGGKITHTENLMWTRHQDILIDWLSVVT
jgi:hypothetical protein